MRTRIIPLSLLFSTFTVQTVLAQANLPLYTDNLVNAFQNWSWATVNMANTSPTHTGTRSISVVNGGNFQALYLQHPNFNTSPYGSLSFWINGGPSGGQSVTVHGLLNGASQGGHAVGPLTTNSWQQITFSLSTLGISNKSNCSGIWIQGNSASAQPVFYVDDVQFTAAPAPALVHLDVNATNTVRSADPRWFGLNTAVWDSFFDSTSTSNALKDVGCLSLRFPGGSLSDNYDWYTGTDGGTTRPTKWPNFMHVATNAGVQAFITVNYGTGTSNKAADWVKSANITNKCNFKYWEIGNECYGTWEIDTNTVPHDPYTYATRAAGYIGLMKLADPSIKVGVVAAPGEDSYINNSNHAAFNPRTGQTHYGWTPVMLTTLKNLGVTPDFLVHHVYPQYTPSGGTPPVNDSDPLVLQASLNWARDAAELRQEISDYFGTGGTNIELVCTENNSDAGALGRQLTSIVNGLYIADSMAQLMKTEFNAYTFWDLRNGRGTDGTFDPTLYGWRTFGDEGIMYNTNSTGIDRYPAYYGFKLMQFFARPGETVLNAGSDYLLLSAYAARKTNGTLNLLVINKDSVTNLTAQITLSNFSPSSTASVWSYGIPQDEAKRTNGPVALQDIQTSLISAGSVFTNSFPPFSMTVFTILPAPPQLQTLWATDTQFAFQLQGAPGASYILQTASDLNSGIWDPFSTNTLPGPSLNFTNPIPSGGAQQFWRALWLP